MDQASRDDDRVRAEMVRSTIAALHARMEERFPGRALTHVAGQLVVLADDVEETSQRSRDRLRTARVVSRVASVLLLLGVGVLTNFVVRDVAHMDDSVLWIPLVESTINNVVFVAVALFFFHALPTRVVRGHLLHVLHRLRSMAHVIDLHQLTKSPGRMADLVGDDDADDPETTELYLHCCIELLSLISKVAAVCAEESRDSVVLDTVATVETLTSNLTGHLWQKLDLLDRGLPESRQRG